MRNMGLKILLFVLAVLWSAAVLEAQTPRATNRQIQTLLDRIETKTDTYRIEVERRLSENRRVNRNIDESITGYIADFENATDSLKNDFVGRRANAAQVNDLLNRAWNIDDFMKRNRLGATAENQWRSLRTYPNLKESADLSVRLPSMAGWTTVTKLRTSCISTGR